MFTNTVRNLTDVKVKVKIDVTHLNMTVTSECMYKSMYLNFCVPICYNMDNYILII